MARLLSRTWCALAAALLAVSVMSASPLPAEAQNCGSRSCAASGEPGDFDFYLLSLSWSATYCANHRADGARRPSSQCQDGGGQGFVVHGLWPQYEQGYPSACQPSAPAPSWFILRETGDLYPDPGLARHEWRQHGSCSGKTPSAYFDDVRRARDMVTIPEIFRGDGAGWVNLTGNEIKRRFVEANPGLRADMLTLTCRGSLLSEVRVCLTRDLRGFRPCPQAMPQACRAYQISVPKPF
ncbi:ribonuclease T2 family protein [Beijerinckia indica]|uniref:Ribonuclease T2 n=1 Tax=Beijerinckia indica subsp. indica (strain ATCC 9039 / DSM 1715 / NCIMB 8712) TaxID=395963 RepID=B2IGC5_BEII9|nr:ribonuclease T2 [Beijerinckia indica]ACB94310.1 ribonuclease T2 [Beijerinckia indica subsp. indica ATCC 9039]